MLISKQQHNKLKAIFDTFIRFCARKILLDCSENGGGRVCSNVCITFFFYEDFIQIQHYFQTKEFLIVFVYILQNYF